MNKYVILVNIETDFELALVFNDILKSEPIEASTAVEAEEKFLQQFPYYAFDIVGVEKI